MSIFHVSLNEGSVNNIHRVQCIKYQIKSGVVVQCITLTKQSHTYFDHPKYTRMMFKSYIPLLYKIEGDIFSQNLSWT